MPLPTFLISGERRSGTTSLVERLARHPEIFLHPKRDSGWFVDESVRKGSGPAWEDSHSPEAYSDWFEGVGITDEKQIGEKSADYLFYRPCHPRLAAYVPDAKHILTLRNPTERAWSHYWNDFGKGRERLPFAEAIAAEIGRTRSDPYEVYHLSYVSRGFYDESLEHFFRYIDPERVLVLTLDEISQDPSTALRTMCEFLDVDPSFDFGPSTTRHNANWTMVPKPWARAGALSSVAGVYGSIANAAVNVLTRDRSRRRKMKMGAKSLMFEPAARQTLPAAERAKLQEIFAPHISRLEQLLGRSFDLWKN